MAGIAFEPIRIPDPVWHQHEATLRARDIGALFRLAKQNAGASQNRIAAATGVAQSRVNELMNRGGPVTSMRPRGRPASGSAERSRPARPCPVCAGAGTPGRGGPRSSGGRSQPAGVASSGRTENAEVRALLAHAAEVTMGVSDPDAAHQRAASGEVVTPVPSRIGRADVEQIEHLTAVLRAADYLHGGGACREAAAAQTRWVTRLLDVPADDDTTLRLHLTLADLHNLAGWASLDVGPYSAARSHFAQALVHARTAGQASLVANILYRTGRLHLHRAMTSQALRFFQLGQIAAQDAGATRRWPCCAPTRHGPTPSSATAAQAIRVAEPRRRRTGPRRTRAAAPWVGFFGPTDLDALTG